MFENRNGTPFCCRYQDIYFSSEHGLEESRHVFIRGSDLNRRWRHKPRYVIAETGFGTGLNFLASWEHWRNDGERPEVLHYISVEKHPLAAEDLAVSHRQFPDLSDLSSQLIENYPDAYPGFHRIWLDNHRVCLTLCIMDVCAALKELDAVVDSWFLDGFAPAKNPDMWTKQVFRHLARLGRKGTSIATFTAAGHVRRGLDDAGFEIKKIAGYSRKREMTVGTLESVPRVRAISLWRKFPKPVLHGNDVTVIGAGIAGAQVAWHLAQRGLKVTVVEQQASVATAASGNPRGIVAPRLAAQPGLEETFSVTGFLSTLNQLATSVHDRNCWSPCGVLNLANNERKQAQWHAVSARQLPASLVLAVDPGEASDIAGVRLEQPALYYPAGGWMVTQDFIKRLLAHPNIVVQCNSPVTSLGRRDAGWDVAVEHGGSYSTEAVVIANGSDLSALCPAYFPVDLIAGQTTLAQSSRQSADLQCVLQHDGYITPASNNKHLIGASYHRNATSLVPDPELDMLNLQQQKRNIPGVANRLGGIETAHSGMRVATPTRFPLVGAVPDTEFFTESVSNPGRTGNNAEPWYPGLYVAAAFGSRGLTTSALAAEILCSEMLGEPAPIPVSLKSALEPVRWIAAK